MASQNLNNAEIAKLQQELEYLTNLVSNHEKLQQTGKKDPKLSVLIQPVKNTVLTGSCSKSLDSVPTSIFPPKSNININRRSVVQNKYKSSLSRPPLFATRFPIESTLPGMKRNLPPTAYKKINYPQQRTVYNSKHFVPKVTVNVPTRLVLPPQVTLQNTNEPPSKSCTGNSTKSNDLRKTLSETKEVFMKVGSKKRIDELNALTKKLDERNLASSKNKNLSAGPLKSNDMLKNVNSKLCVDKSSLVPFKKTNFISEKKSELDILNCKVEELARKYSIKLENSSEKVPENTMSSLATLQPSKNISNFSKLAIANVELSISHSVMKTKSAQENKSLLISKPISEMGEAISAELVKSSKIAQSNCAANTSTALNSTKNSISDSSSSTNIETSIAQSLVNISNKHSSVCLLKSSDVLKNVDSKLCGDRLSLISFKDTNFISKDKSELDILKCKVEELVKFSIKHKISNEKFPKNTMSSLATLQPSKKISNVSKLAIPNVRLLTNQSVMKTKNVQGNISLVVSKSISEMSKDNSAKLVENSKIAQLNCTLNTLADLHCTKNSISDSSSTNIKMSIAQSLVNIQNILGKGSNSSPQFPKMGTETPTKLVENSKIIQSDCALKSLATLHSSKNGISDLSALNAEAQKVHSIIKIKNGNTSKQVSELDEETSIKALNGPKQGKSNNALTPPTKRLKIEGASSIKKPSSSLATTDTRASIANCLGKVNLLKSNLFISSLKETPNLGKGILTKLAKSPNHVQCSYTSTPSAKRTKSPKFNSVKKQVNMTKLISSKYRVVNKILPNSPVVSGQNRFLKTKSVASFNSINKWSQNACTTYKRPPIIKALNTNYKVVNLVKSPRKLGLLKSSSPKNLKECKYTFKKLDACMRLNVHKFPNVGRPNGYFPKSFVQKPIAIKPKAHFKHTKVNYLIGASPKKSAKLYISKKSNSSSTPVNSKYKIVNKPGSSKKLSKSLILKSDGVCRTQSGVDIDLLLELAAEKESIENENRIKALMKRPVLLKRVYKSKNAIVNKNTSSCTGAKVAKMIKAKYLLNKKNVWDRQAIPRKFMGAKHFKGHRFSSSFQKTPTQFYNHRIKRNYFKSPAQNPKHSTKFMKNNKGSPHYNKSLTNRNYHLRSLPNQVKSTPLSKVVASRVLHRSINRALTASVKKNVSKVNTYCMFYNRFGRCNKGLKCTYIHDPSKIAVCTRFLRGTCKKQNCLFSHEISPGKMAICSFFLLDSCTKTDCPYRHETLSPDAQLCKAFVQGYCPEGKLCKKAHILVCPKYIQGFCEKGDACAFPHPPPKEKKILPKPIAKTETEAEDLMERVSRYFQSSNEKGADVGETTVVPRRQKLPEQPSFIAL